MIHLLANTVLVIPGAKIAITARVKTAGKIEHKLPTGKAASRTPVLIPAGAGLDSGSQ